MRFSAKINLGIGLILTVFLIPKYGLAHEPSSGGLRTGPVQEASVAYPDLAIIIPLAAELTGRLADQKKRIIDGLNIAAVETQYSGIETGLQTVGGQLERLKESQALKYYKLVELRRIIKQDNELYETISLPITQTIRRLETWRKAWLVEQKRWKEWQSVLNEEGEFERLKATSEKANDTIETALELVLSRLEGVLALQERAGTIQDEINALDVELITLIENERRSDLLDESSPMFSSQFFASFKSGEIWSAAIQVKDEVAWPDSRFFARYGWIVFFQVVVSLLVMISTYRNRRLLNESARWRFFASRPFSAGLFVGYVPSGFIYEYIGPVICTYHNLAVI